MEKKSANGDATPGSTHDGGERESACARSSCASAEMRTAPRRAILRGGWWLIGRNRCRAATDNHSELYAGVQTGFRCCRAPR